MGQNGQLYRAGKSDEVFPSTTKLGQTGALSYPTHATTVRDSNVQSGDIKNVMEGSKNQLSSGAAGHNYHASMSDGTQSAVHELNRPHSTRNINSRVYTNQLVKRKLPFGFMV